MEAATFLSEDCPFSERLSSGMELFPVENSRENHDFAERLARSQSGEGGAQLGERIGVLDHRFDFAFSRPVQGHFDIGAIPAVTADEPLLFDEKRPKIEANFSARGGPASDDCPAAGEALESMFENFPSNVLDNEVHAAFLSNIANERGPARVQRIDGKFSAPLSGELAFGFGRAGGDHARAEFPGNLDGVGSHAASSSHDQNPVTGMHLRPVREHVHGGAPGETQGRGSGEVEIPRDRDERAGGDRDTLGEPAIAIHPEQFAMQADGFIAAQAEFTPPAE
jgi:hypothetical protein